MSDNQNMGREDQAEELRRLVYDVEQEGEGKDEHDTDQEMETREIDILNLPPRKEVHGKKQGRVKLKTSTSFKRLLFVIFVMMIILFIIYFFYSDAFTPIFNPS
ncbi:hypothetical protein [Virgibacillus kimchii]